VTPPDPSTLDPSSVTAAQIEAWFRRHIAALIGTTPDAVDGGADFESFGIDSLQAVDMIVALEKWLGMPDDLPMEMLFEAPSISDAARSVAEARARRTARS